MEFPAIIAGVKANEPAACEELVRMIRSRWANRTSRYLGDDAEDAVQEMCWRAIQAIRNGQVKEERFLATWVGAICINHTHGYWRKHHRHWTQRVSLDEALQVRDPEPTAEEVLVKQSRTLSVMLRLRALNYWQRTVIELHHGQGMPVEEVASVLGRNVNTVKVILWRARIKLRNAAA